MVRVIAMLSFVVLWLHHMPCFKASRVRLQEDDLHVDGLQGKCQRSCSVLNAFGGSGWTSTKTQEEVFKLLDAKCEWKSCRGCDGKKHGTHTPCCEAGQCDRRGGVKESVAPQDLYRDDRDRDLDIAAITSAVADAGIDLEEDGVDVDGLKDLVGNVAPVASEVKPSITEEEKKSKPCPAKVTWNMNGFPRCRNYVDGDRKGQFVKTACCKSEIEDEARYHAAKRMCMELANTDCKKAEGKARKKAGKGEEAIRSAVQKVFNDAKVAGIFPLGYKCKKMYNCLLKEGQFVGPFESCHQNGVAIGTKYNTCAAVLA